MDFVNVVKSVASHFCKGVKGLDRQNGRTIEAAKFTRKQEWIGLAIFSLLFMTWGLAYGMLDIMNYHIKVALGAKRAQAAQLALAYYSAYFTVGFFGGPITRKLGYRVAAVTGVIVLAVGTMLMSEGAAALSLSAMCGAHFVVGLGVSTLERCANAYAVQAGPGSRRPIRELIGQSAAAFGTVLAPIIAKAAIYEAEAAGKAPSPDPNRPGRCLVPGPPPKGQAGDLSQVVSFYRYLGGGLFAFAFVMACLFFGTHIVVEPHMQQPPKKQYSPWKFWKHSLLGTKYFRTLFGVGANFLNLGCQVTVAQFFLEHMRVNACQTDGEGAHSMMIAQILFLFGRLVVAGLIEIPALPFLGRFKTLREVLRPRIVLSVSVALAALFTGLGIIVGGTLAFTCACLVMFFEAPTFPMIFESASAGLGNLTPSAESFIITSIAGGGILPPANGLLADAVGVSSAWSLATTAFACVFGYTVLCSVVPSWRRAIDAAHEEENKDNGSEDIELHARPK